MDWVKQVHLHDVGYDREGSRRSHRIIGSGEVDFEGLLQQLKNTDILDFCIEVRPGEKARESLQRLTAILARLS